jgi:large subunit ribosomal protein L22
MPETIARLRYHRASPSKVRQVLRLIVGADANEAREILRFCERGPSEPVMKLLDSAIANAEHNDNVPEDELFVLRAFADEGPTLKRGRPRARGRYGRIKKRTSHITIVVARYDDDELDRRRQREAAVAAPSRVSRRRRVQESRRRSRAAIEEHDHDHDEHDHDHDDDEHDHEAEEASADEVELVEDLDELEEPEELEASATDDTDTSPDGDDETSESEGEK